MFYSLVPIVAFIVVLTINYDVLFVRSYPYKNKRTFIAYRALIISVLFFFLFDLAWGYLDQLENKIFASIDAALYFEAMAVAVTAWFRFVATYTEEKNTFSKLLIIVGYIFFATGTALVITNFFHPVLFSYESTVYDVRLGSKIYLVSQSFLYVVTSIYSFVYFLKTNGYKKGRYFTIMAVGVMMAITTIFQFFNPLYPLFALGCVSSLTILHIFIVSNEKSEYRDIIEDVSIKQKAQSKELYQVKQLAYLDPLTGVKSKHAYVELENEIDILIREKRMPDFSLFIFDLNDLKIINDKYGHEIGDKYIIKSVNIIKKLIPDLDIYRYGGDEFVVILKDDYFVNRYQLLDTFNKQIEDNLHTTEPIIAVGFSDFIVDKDNTLQSVFTRADERMYSRKRKLKEMNGELTSSNESINISGSNRLSLYEMFYRNSSTSLIEMLENSNADEILEVDLNNDKFQQFYHVEGKYFLPLIDSSSYRDLIDFVANYIVHPDDKGTYLDLMKIDGFFERLQSASIPNFNFAHFRYKLQNGKYRYVEQCVITGEENGIEKGKFRIYIIDINNLKIRQSSDVSDEEGVISVGRDSLTGLLTGKEFFNKAQKHIQNNPNYKWCFLSIDIEHFKLFDEWFGRDKGDILLAKIGAELSKSETLMNGVAGYFGQDNFVMLSILDEQLIKHFYNRIKTQIDSFGLTGGLLPAIGVSSIEDDIPLADAYNRSTIASSKAKEDITNRIFYYNADMQFRSEQEYRILTEFMKALQHDEITFYLQPQCRFEDEKIVGAEALARWIKKDGEIVPPGIFVPVLEKFKFITDLDKIMWEKVFIWLRKALDNNIPVVPISINVSRIDIYNIDIHKFLCSLSEKYNVPHKLIKVEITESVYASNTDKIDELVKKLQEDNFLVLMDDFGSGYSSLNMLSNLKLDAIKLDANFLKVNGEDQTKGVHILESVVNMAKSMALPTIVEGVETKKQRDFLVNLGCQYAQGYYYYKPMPVDEFEVLISKPNIVSTKGIVVKANEQFRIREFLDKNIYSDSMLNTIIGSVAIYSWNKDQDHVDIVRYNQQFFEAVGVPEFSERLTNIEQFLPKVDRPKIFKVLKEAMENRYSGARETLRFYRTDGTLSSFSIHFYHLGRKEGSERFYGSAINVTELTDFKDATKLIAQYSTDNMIFITRVYDKWRYKVISHGLSDVLSLSPAELEKELNDGRFAKRVLDQKALKNFMIQSKKNADNKMDFTQSFTILDNNHKQIVLDLTFKSVKAEASNIEYILITKIAK